MCCCSGADALWSFNVASKHEKGLQSISTSPRNVCVIWLTHTAHFIAYAVLRVCLE
jgi:hypothetical protein